MDFLKTLLAYMATTLVVAVESTSTPVVTPIPTPAPTASIVETAVRETATMIPVVTPSPEPTVSVTPAPVPLITPNTRGYHNLLQGDRGEEVRRLQEKLIELGYLPEGSADGAFGGQTRRAVRAFQYYNGLEVDGIAGRTTQTNLFENPDVARYPSESEATETPTVSSASPTAEDTEAAAENVTAAPAAAAEEAAKPAEEKTEEPAEAPAETVTAAPAAAAEEAAKPAKKTEEPAEAPAESAENAENATAEPAKESAEKQEESTAAETVVTVSAETAAAGPATALTEGIVTTEPAPAPAKEAAESVTAAPTEGSRTAIYILTEEAETPAQATAEPAKEAETPAQATAEPVKETEAPAQETAEPGKETEAPAQATAEPAKESGKPAGEETAAPEEKTNIEEKSEAPVAEMMEHVDLDLLEQTPVPQATATPEPVHYEDLAGWVVLNDSGESMQWRALEDGVPVVRSPRLQRHDEDIRVSLDDLCESVESWTLTGEGNSLILEAQGFVLALLQEDAGFVSTVDGLEMVTESRDFDFGEGHFIRVDFLTRALDGSWAWDAEEETLMLRIPQKNPALYTD